MRRIGWEYERFALDLDALDACLETMRRSLAWCVDVSRDDACFTTVLPERLIPPYDPPEPADERQAYATRPRVLPGVCEEASMAFYLDDDEYVLRDGLGEE